MQYISHEIRTPLNIVKAGLHVLAEDIEQGIDKSELIETSKDIDSSLDIAIDMLSEILTHEKLESKNMSLDLSSFPVKIFIRETLRPFYLQVNPFLCNYTLICISYNLTSRPLLSSFFSSFD